MAFWVYLLQCADGRFYTGQTDDLDRRISEHNHGGFCDFTSRRRPVNLVWSEQFGTRIEALQAERTVGGWSRAKKQALIAGDWSLVSHFAKPPGERFSTSLETNGKRRETNGERQVHSPPHPFVSSDACPEHCRGIEKRSPAPSVQREEIP